MSAPFPTQTQVNQIVDQTDEGRSSSRPFLSNIPPGVALALLGLGSALRGEDSTRAILGGADILQQQKRQREQEELQKRQEEFFTDPKYQDMAKIFGVDFALQQRQRDIEVEEETLENEKFFKAIEGTDYEKIYNIVGPEQTKRFYIQEELKKDEAPADIKKLERLNLLKSKLDPQSKNYDPNYTDEDFKQELSILGVNAKFLEGKKEFIEEYAKQMRTVKDNLGRLKYTEEEIKVLAENAYNLYNPDSANNDNELVIDLGQIER